MPKPSAADLLQYFDDLLDFFDDNFSRDNWPAIADRSAEAKEMLVAILESQGLSAIG